MSQGPEPERHHLVLARLREEIRRIEHRPARREGFVPCGLPGVDEALPGGGFPRGALAELSGGPASGKTAVALSLFAALGTEGLCAYVDGRGEIYPPAAAARGVDLSRLLVVRPGRVEPPRSRPGPPSLPHEAPPRGDGNGRRPRPRPWLPGLWAAELLLASGAFAAVAVDVPVPRAFTGADSAARRLQAAAERGGAVGLWLASGTGSFRVPAAVRLSLASEKGRIVARRAAVEPAAAAGSLAAAAAVDGDPASGTAGSVAAGEDHRAA